VKILREATEDGIEEVFPELSRWVYEAAGIVLPHSKVGLVRSRLQRRLRETGFESFPEYFRWATASDAGDERTRMIDLLTTNKTHFYRESAHFEFLRASLGTPPLDQPRLQIWSAGCSTGEEPYTLSAILRSALTADRSFRILATDLSTRVIRSAQVGQYPVRQAQDVPAELRRHLFEAAGDDTLRVRDEVRRPVSFARLNLLHPWPMQRPFQVIMCRNVMIYFDHATRERLVHRFTQHLAPGGYLFVGHSESLNGIDHDLRYVRPAVYRR
jgi:chemotaxis protein methyltransferase CheR